MVHLIVFYDIPPSLLINMDQCGVYVLPHSSTTYHDRGARQVNIVAKDEKCTYTMCVASTTAGDFLPLQQVWSGKSQKSLPAGTAPGMDEALALGFDFAFADSPKRTSHFSTLKTMKEACSSVTL